MFSGFFYVVMIDVKVHHGTRLQPARDVILGLRDILYPTPRAFLGTIAINLIAAQRSVDLNLLAANVE